MTRHRANTSYQKRRFRNTARKTRALNVAPSVSRGGIRM